MMSTKRTTEKEQSPILEKLSTLMGWIITGAGYLGAYLVVVGMLITTYDVVARYVFNRPAVFAYDMTRWIYFYCTLLLAPLLLRKEGHVKIDIVLVMLQNKTHHALLETINSLLIVIGCAFLLWQGVVSTAEDIVANTLTNAAIRVPRWWLFVAIPISAFLLTYQAFARLRSKYHKLVATSRGKELRADSEF